MIDYKDLLKKLEASKEEHHLLLGNGFNHSLRVNTGYENIFTKMKEDFEDYKDLKIKDKNYDLESIIGSLKEQIKGGNDEQFIKKFLNNKIKLDFMKATSIICKDAIKNVYQEKNQGVAVLFKNFTNYFTLNYDPLLYLLLMKLYKDDGNKAIAFQHSLDFKIIDINIKDDNNYKKIKEIYCSYTKELKDANGTIVKTPFNKLTKTDFEKQLKDVLKQKGIKYNKEYTKTLYEELKNENNEKSIKKLNDGFFEHRYNENDINKDKDTQNLFFLHGAFHIYKKENINYKITQKQDKELYERLAEIIDSEKEDIVCIFTNSNKEKEIKNNKYLSNCLKKLETLTGSMVIIGSSLDKNDNHIFKYINQSKIKTIYYGIHNKNILNKTEKRLKELFREKEIILFNTETISYEKV